MTPPAIMPSLQTLRAPSGKRLPDSVITGMTLSLTRARYDLVHSTLKPGGGTVLVLRQGGAVAGAVATLARRKLMTIPLGDEAGFTKALNTALLGGESYPVLTAILGTAVGAASAGAGLLFTVATTALDVSRAAARVLARPGDELWQVEEIGKVRDGSAEVVVHVGSYFLVDPYRHSAMAKGWLIHEERLIVSV